ncbi:MAG: CPBP family intramembrane glutamic endopeptidase [Spirochaetales bacterium]
MQSTVRIRKVALFLGLAFGISWLSALSLYLMGVEYGSPMSLIGIAVFFMWAPAAAAVAVQLAYREPIRRGCLLRIGRIRVLLVAWLLPTVVFALTLGIALLLPRVRWTRDYARFLEEMGLDSETIAQSIAQLEAIPVPTPLFFIFQALVAGLTINALFAFGEELGWRGFLLRELAPLGFWKLSVLTGGIWGVWHAPVILQGHNFPESPYLGIIVMTVQCMAMSPVYTYLTVRASSVLAAAFFHGSFNALASLVLVYLTGAGNIVVSPVGIAGIVTALILTAACVFHDRFVASTRIIGGGPLPVQYD